MGSDKFHINEDNLNAILKVLLWSGLSAFAVALPDLLGVIEWPTAWAFAGAILNTLAYTFKEWVEDNRDR